MTLDELDAIPEMGGGFGIAEEVIGDRVVRRCQPAPMCALYHGPDDPLMIWDRSGRAWAIGWHEGQRYKRCLR